MEFINEKNDIFSASNFIHHRLDPLFKLTTIFGASNHQREVKGDDFFIMQNFRHIARHNLLGETFNNSSLTNTGFTQQYWIVFGPAAEHLNDPFNFVLSTDHRIQLILFGHLSEVTSESAQGRSLGLFTTTTTCFSFRFLFRFLRRKIRIEFL